MTLEGCSVEADIDGFIHAKSTGTEPPGEAWPQLSDPPLPGRGRAARGSLLGAGALAGPREGVGDGAVPWLGPWPAVA